VKELRKHYQAGEKVAILRRHLLEKEPISKLCVELDLQPTVFHPRVGRGSAGDGVTHSRVVAGCGVPTSGLATTRDLRKRGRGSGVRASVQSSEFRVHGSGLRVLSVQRSRF